LASLLRKEGQEGDLRYTSSPQATPFLANQLPSFVRRDKREIYVTRPFQT
jgi:hypothetical protein